MGVCVHACVRACVFLLFCTSSSRLKSLDPFSAQKESAFTQSLPAITALACYVLDISSSNATEKDTSDHFSALFHVRLIQHLTCRSFLS